MASSSVLGITECRSIISKCRKPLDRKLKRELERVVESISFFILTLNQENGEDAKEVAKVFEDLQVLILREITNSNEENAKLKKKMEALEKEIEKMKTEMERLKGIEDQLLIGQVAFETEKKIVQYILKGTGVDADHVTINNIEQELNTGFDSRRRRHRVFTSQEQMDKANDNWERLDEELKLESSFYRAIIGLKHYRNCTAHPRFTPESVEKLSGKERLQSRR